MSNKKNLMSHMEEVFTNIYETEQWGSNNNEEYSGSSGPGSDSSFNKETFIPVTKAFIKDNNIKTIVDIGSGDFRCGEALYNDLDITYTGYDTYSKVVKYLQKKYKKEKKYTFIHSDVTIDKESIKGADLCIINDVFQHWPNHDIISFMDYIMESKKFKYILLCHCYDHLGTDGTPDAFAGGTGATIITGNFRPISCEKPPLLKYQGRKLYNYYTKEVSVIDFARPKFIESDSNPGFYY